MSICNEGDGCNVYDWVQKWLTLLEISLVTLTTMIVVHALIAEIATIAATRMYVCLIG